MPRLGFFVCVCVGFTIYGMIFFYGQKYTIDMVLKKCSLVLGVNSACQPKQDTRYIDTFNLTNVFLQTQRDTIFGKKQYSYVPIELSSK